MTTTNDAIAKLAAIAQTLTGVQFSEKHREMIKARLQKRLVELNLKSADDYLVYFEEHRKEETPKFIGLLTTHHTYFFREFAHFEFLLTKALPALVPIVQKRADKTMRVWSAACSRGQEVYSLAMFLDFHLKQIDPALQFEILGTDIDSGSVDIAKNGVYQFSELKEVPMSMLGTHWARGTGDIAAFAKVKTSLRNRCKFQTANLLNFSVESLTPKKFDVIFCRNVFIYFNPDQIRTISADLLKALSPTGFFFIGISESLLQLGLPIQSAGPSVYQPKVAAEKVEAATAKPAAPMAPAAIAPQAPKEALPPLIRVVCVDDSPVILTLMKQVLSKEKGFEIVGTAMNGLEAAERIRDLKPDAVTLDIHMPEQTGIEYLEKNFKPGHVPVVMVTSVTRENSDLAGKALTLGASDYVEKPALSNLAERGDEIRTKVRCAHLAFQASSKVKLTLDKSFQRTAILREPNSKLRIISISLSQRSQLKKLFAELTGVQPPTIILIDGAREALGAVAPVLGKECSANIMYGDSFPAELKAGDIWLMDFATHAKALVDQYGSQRKTSILVYGEVSKGSAQRLAGFTGAQLVLEDLGQGRGCEALMEIASDVVVPTSFAYLSTEFLAADGNVKTEAKAS